MALVCWQQPHSRAAGVEDGAVQCSAVQQGGGSSRFLPNRLRISVLKLLERRRWMDRDSTAALQQRVGRMN